MSSHHLPIYRANAELDAEELALPLGSPGASPQTLDRFCIACRIAAISSLLLEADADAFRRGLAASAGALRAWLGFNAASDLAVSRCFGFIDALAAGDWQTANVLATSLGPAEWKPEAEYEEAYLYTKLLLSRVADGDAGAPMRRELLERYRILEGDEVDWRLELCAALEGGNAERFDAALEGLMLAMRDEFEYVREKEALRPEELATLGCISIEGVALHRLGTTAGLRLQRDYLFIPSLALDPPTAL